MRGCLLLLFGIVVGAVGLGAALAFMYGPPPLAAPAPASYDARVVLSAAFLDRELQAQAAQTTAAQSFRGLTLQTTDGDQVVVSGTVVASGGAVHVPIRVIVHPVVQGNRLDLQIARTDLGGLPLPTAMFQSLQNAMNRQLSQMLGDTTYRIVGVSTDSQGIAVDLAISGSG